MSRNSVMVLTLSAPIHYSINIPSIADRLTGFSIAGHFTDETEDDSGLRSYRYEYLLSPTVAQEYRIAPIPVTYKDTRHPDNDDRWIPTPALNLARMPLSATPGVAALAGPEKVPLSPRAIALLVLLALLTALLIFALVFVIKKMQRQLELRRMSPRERAFRELEELVEKDLVAQGLAQDFYYELTMIVRLYIERAHKVHAPEQTTEEFLASVAQDRRFRREVIEQLRTFLQAADLVKYAAQEADQPMVSASLSTARDYITRDEAQTVAEAPDV